MPCCSKPYRKSVTEETNSNLSVMVVPSSWYHFDHQGCFQLSLLLRTSLSSNAIFFIAYPTWWTCRITSVSSQVLYCVLWTLMSPPTESQNTYREGVGSREAEIAALYAASSVQLQAHRVVCKQSHLPRLRTGTILGNPNTLLAYWPLDNLLRQQWNLQCAGEVEGQRWEDALLP